MARIRILAGVLLTIGSSAPAVAQAPAESMLQPGNARLVPFVPSIAAETITVFARPKNDTVDRKLSTLIRTEQALPGDPSLTLVTSTWARPYDSRDSLVIDRALAPVSETLFFNGALRTYQYRGKQITGSTKKGDAGPVPYAVDFPMTPIAFNEVELLVRALDYKPGLQVIAPLFSEVDQAIEHDTLTVLRRGAPIAAGSDSTWVLRFADPAITTIYAVDPKTRRIVDAVTTNRASGMVLRYSRKP